MIKKIASSPAVQSARRFLTSQNYLVILALIAAVVAIRLPIDTLRIMTPTDNDYSSHIDFALNMFHGRPVPAFTLAHSLWQLFLIFLWLISRNRIDFWQSAILLQVLSSVAAALILYFWFGALKNRPNALLRAAAAVSLVIVTPVVLPGLLDGYYYFGYLGLANYHNPTVHVLRPMALIMFFYALSALETPRHSGWHIAFCFLVFAAGTFLKPSYTVSLGPVLVLFVLYRQFVQRCPVDWKLLVIGMGLPSVLFLAPQFVITYISGEPDGGIALMPLVAASMMSEHLGIKFLLSIVFPLAVLALNFRAMLRDRAMLLAWATFAWGASQFYLLIELGSRYTHGNFLWSAQIALFILFAATIRFLLEHPVERPRTLAGYLAYVQHVIAGIIYYIYCYTTPHYG